MSIYFINAQAVDIISQDWGPDLNLWSESAEALNVHNQDDLIQSDLFGSTGSTLQNPGLTGPEDSDPHDWMDFDALTLENDDTLLADADFVADSCTSDNSLPRISKRKKSKKICPADSTSSSSSSSRVKESDCRPESEICPIGKTAMCCIGEKQGWLKWEGFSVGNCIKCNLYFLPKLQSLIDLPPCGFYLTKSFF